MEKPVRIVSNEKIRTFNEKVRNGLEHALNFMLGTEGAARIQFGPFDPFLMPIETYISAYRKKSILVKIAADKAFKGELYWFFEMKSAVVLGGMLRALPAPPPAEKVAKDEFDETDRDAFGEVGNQLSGILDRAFRALTNKNIHLKMDFGKKVYPDENIKLETFINKEEYVVLLSEVTLPDYGKQKLTLLLPRSLYEVLLNIELQLDGITPKILLVHSWNADRVEALQASMNSRYTKVIPLAKPEEVLEKLDTPHLTAVAMDLKSLSFPLTHVETIFFKRLTANRTFMRLPLFLSWEGSSEAGLNELRRTGIMGGTTASLETDFAKWAHAFTKDPSRIP
ncbi:MAG: hypothetical protein ACXVCS_08915 [Bdellovibrionota bacterium]